LCSGRGRERSLAWRDLCSSLGRRALPRARPLVTLAAGTFRRARTRSARLRLACRCRELLSGYATPGPSRGQEGSSRLVWIISGGWFNALTCGGGGRGGV